jgi:RND family efflux transporter MFP subunit
MTDTEAELMAKRGKILIIAAAAAAVILLLIVWRYELTRTPKEKRPAVSGVTVAVIHPVEVNDYYETSGTIKAKTVSDVASRVMGTVTAVNVREGDTVTEGQELLTIENSDLTQKVKAAKAASDEANKALQVAKANKTLADTTYRRYKKLFEDKAISGQEMDQMENQKRVADLEYARSEAAASRARANLDETKVAAGYSKIISPTGGIVSKKNIDVGSMAVPGTVLMVVEDVSAFEVDAQVDERLVDKVKVDASADVSVDSIGAKFKGIIATVVHAVDPMSRTYLVKISVPADANEHRLLKTGLYAKVLVPQGKKTTMLVPAKAVIEKGQLVGVYAVDEHNVVSYRLIRIGKNFNGSVEVLSGLGDGQRIIVEGVQNAVDGGMLTENVSEG